MRAITSIGGIERSGIDLRGNCGNDMMMIFGELSDDELLPVVYNTTR